MSDRGARVFARCEDETRVLVWPDVGELVVHSARSPAKPGENEDAALVLRAGPGRMVAAVADGVGGHRAGGQASREALEALRSALVEHLAEGESLRGAFLSGLDRANRAVLGIGAGAATTLAAITVDEARVRAYHVGDSGVLAFGAQGKLKLETIPHSPVAYGVQAGLIAEDDAMVHADRHLVSNVLGDPDMHIGVSSPLDLRPRDRVLVASDGLFDNATVGEIVDTMRRGELRDAVGRLAAACRARMETDGHPDDLTIVAFRLAPRAEGDRAASG